MNNEIKTVWTKKESKRGIEPILLARRINTEWLQSSISVMSVRFSGDLLGALIDLREAVRTTKKNLPTNALRLMLQASMDGVIHVDKDLGCDTRYPTPAIELHESQSGDEVILKQIADQVKTWCINTLEVWAQREQFGELAIRVKKAAIPQNISLTSSQQSLRDPKTKAPNFTLIARLIAEQLSGDVLFDGMGPCEIVIPESPFGSSIDLMSAPRKPVHEAGGKNAFSMIARVQISTVPYSKDVYFSVSCAKRVWAEKAPDGGNTGSRATGYVMAPGRPVIPVAVVRRKVNDVWSWDFDDEYASLNIEAKGALQPSLKAALAHSAYSTDEWWSGLPQVTRLYRRVDQHTPMESDEVQILRTVLPMLAGVVDAEIPTISRRLKLNKKPESAMLRLEDVGAAGVSIADAEDDELQEDAESEDDLLIDGERSAVARFREQCVDVLMQSDAIPSSGAKPGLWIIGGTQQEQELASKTAELLFGDSIEIKVDPLPPEVHGLKTQLPGTELKARLRFGLGVSAWERSGLPAAIAKHEASKFVLICANKEIERRSEDPVNRRAAIHAICSLSGASVHHVLPIEEVAPARLGKATQSFIHRTQSAMMDVMLAHSGYVIGARDFVAGQLDEDQRPKAIYGVQALRRQAQRYSGETPVCLIIYSKLNLQTCITEVSFAYKVTRQTKQSPWMPLARALIWLGSQRNLEGDEDWLKAEFQRATILALNEIKLTDPRAIVFIDWGNLRGLWKEITDASLMVREPALGHVDLATHFPHMSFVRIRYGHAALMPLRSWSKTIYEGFREEASRQATGEYWEDGYPITVKQLVEVNPDPQHPQRGHFVGVMSPRKTFQLKRGKSCFRVMTRMSPVDAKGSDKKQKGIFEKMHMPPADKDATIPSSMDITVLHSPKGVNPLEIATLAMGLRVGYAHYDDWTMLPAPLFFSRKIDDYIIKYPLAEDNVIDVEALDMVSGEVISVTGLVDPIATEGVNDDVSSGTDSSELAESPKLRMITKLIQRELNLEFPKSDDVVVLPLGTTAMFSPEELGSTVVSIDVVETQTGAEVSKAVPDVDELIAQARANKPPLLYPAPEPKFRRVYSAMVRGQIKVQVELPYFVNLHGFFGKYAPEMKKNIQKSWKQIEDFGYVAPNRPRPDFIYYFDWLAEKLKHPQGASMTNARVLFGRTAVIPEVHDILTKYNLTAEEKISSFIRQGVTLSIDLKPIVVKACEEDDDRTLGWLIFSAAQTPSFGFAESVINNLTKIPGPMTQAALLYYIQCSQAIKLAVDQFSGIGTFKEIYHQRQFTPPPAAASIPIPSMLALSPVAASIQTLADSLFSDKTPSKQTNMNPRKAPTQGFNTASGSAVGKLSSKSLQLPDREVAVVDVDDSGDSTELTKNNEINGEVMQMKSDIKLLVEQLEPGAEAFAGQMEQVRGLLEKLFQIDAKEREFNNKQASILERHKQLAQLAIDILGKIPEIDDEEVVGCFQYVDPNDDSLDLAAADVVSLERAFGKAEVPSKQLMDYLSNPLKPGSLKADHIRRAEQVSGLNITVNDELAQVRRLLEASPYFATTEKYAPPPTSPDGGSKETAAENVASDAQVEALEPKQTLKAAASDAPDTIAVVEQPAPVAKTVTDTVTPEVMVAPAVVTAVETVSVRPVVKGVPKPVPKKAILMMTPVNDVAETVAPVVEAVLVTPAAPLATLAPVVAATPSQHIQVDTRHDTQSSQLTNNEIELVTAYVRLQSLIELRHYGLASVYIDAIKCSFEGSQVATHCVILQALTETLESIDCNFVVDTKLNPGLRDLLLDDKASNDLNYRAHLGVLAAGFVSAVFVAPQGTGDSEGDAL